MLVKSRLITALAAGAAMALAPSVGLAQSRPAPTPEQRIDRLERQVQQVQRQVFPKGRPAETAGFSDDPAATQSSVVSLDQRLDALEKQMADLVRASEENGNRLRNLETGLGQLKNDEDQRIAALEQRAAQQQPAIAPGPAETPPTIAPAPPPSRSRRTAPSKTSATLTEPPATAAVAEPAHHCSYTSATPAAKKVSLPPATPDYAASYQATINTNLGKITVNLLNSKATCTVNSFVHLAQAGYFDNTQCHRVVNSGIYVLQCGDPYATATAKLTCSTTSKIVPFTIGFSAVWLREKLLVS